MARNTKHASSNDHARRKGVATTGYAELAEYGDDKNQSYTAELAGTSSATPIVASAAVLVQSAAKKRLSRVLTPAEMRQLLFDTSLVQSGAVNAYIGPLPYLPQRTTDAADALSTSHEHVCYLRGVLFW